MWKYQGGYRELQLGNNYKLHKVAEEPNTQWQLRLMSDEVAKSQRMDMCACVCVRVCLCVCVRVL